MAPDALGARKTTTTGTGRRNRLCAPGEHEKNAIKSQKHHSVFHTRSEHMYERRIGLLHYGSEHCCRTYLLGGARSTAVHFKLKRLALCA